MTDKKTEPAALAVAAASPEQIRESYNRAVREARLVTINLVDVNFSVSPQAYGGNDTDPRRGFGSEIKDFQYDTDEHYVFACIRWNLDLKVGNKKVVKCHADYNVIYDGFSIDDTETVRRFIKFVATPATYAYFRAFYAQLDWSAGLNSPPLPVLKIMPDV